MHEKPEKYKKYHLFANLKHALEGIWYGLKFENNAKIQTLIAVFFVLMNLFTSNYNFALAQTIFYLLTISQEIINSSLELVCDLITIEYNEKIKRIKDMAAGSVLLVAFAWLLLIILNLAYLFKIL